MPNQEGETPVKPLAEEASQQSDAAPDQVSAGDLAEQLAALAAERDRLAAEKAELEERLLRRMAEFENFRRRIEREKEELREIAAMDVLRKILPFLDDLERALKVETTDKQYARGVEMILERLSAELKKAGLETIDTEGKPFDPHVHHALEIQPTSEAEENTILAEYQKGYSYRGRLLRPALVKVAAAPAPEKQAES